MGQAVGGWKSSRSTALDTNFEGHKAPRIDTSLSFEDSVDSRLDQLETTLQILTSQTTD